MTSLASAASSSSVGPWWRSNVDYDLEVGGYAGLLQYGYDRSRAGNSAVKASSTLACTTVA